MRPPRSGVPTHFLIGVKKEQSLLVTQVPCLLDRTAEEVKSTAQALFSSDGQCACEAVVACTESDAPCRML